MLIKSARRLRRNRCRVCSQRSCRWCQKPSSHCCLKFIERKRQHGFESVSDEPSHCRSTATAWRIRVARSGARSLRNAFRTGSLVALSMRATLYDVADLPNAKPWRLTSALPHFEWPCAPTRKSRDRHWRREVHPLRCSTCPPARDEWAGMMRRSVLARHRAYSLSRRSAENTRLKGFWQPAGASMPFCSSASCSPCSAE